jgi:hypothetical protein
VIAVGLVHKTAGIGQNGNQAGLAALDDVGENALFAIGPDNMADRHQAPLAASLIIGKVGPQRLASAAPAPSASSTASVAWARHEEQARAPRRAGRYAARQARTTPRRTAKRSPSPRMAADTRPSVIRARSPLWRDGS